MGSETRRSRPVDGLPGWSSILVVAFVELGCAGWPLVRAQLERLYPDDLQAYDVAHDALWAAVPMCRQFDTCPRCFRRISDRQIMSARRADARDVAQRLRDQNRRDRDRASGAAAAATRRSHLRTAREAGGVGSN